MDKQLERLQNAVVDFLWDQWVTLGVAGRPSGEKMPFIVDPEALLLATMRFGSGEGRLVSVMLDWLSRNGGLISLQRLKNVQMSSRVGCRQDLAELGRFMEKAGFRNWKSLASWAEKVSSRTGDTGAFENVEMRELGLPPDCLRPETFLLRMRGIFGVSARPEVLTWLLTHSEGYAAEIARETAWFSKSVQAILNDLELAGLVLSCPEGKRRVFSLKSRTGFLDPSLGSVELRWLSQGPFYLGVLHALQASARLAEMADASEGAKAIAIRQEIPAMNAAYRLAGIEDPFAGGLLLTGEELLRCFDEGVTKLLAILELRNFV